MKLGHVVAQLKDAVPRIRSAPPRLVVLTCSTAPFCARSFVQAYGDPSFLQHRRDLVEGSDRADIFIALSRLSAWAAGSLLQLR